MLCYVLAFCCVTSVSFVFAMPSAYKENTSDNEIQDYNFPFVCRAQWKARPPKQTTPLHTPVPFVVIHHTYIPGACYSREECSLAMRQMQNFHMDDRDWWDVGYNFGVGSDGAAYEGRGWETLGAHSLHFNSVSVGICLIGDWRTELPPAEQLKTTKALIAAGVQQGFIQPDYKLVGHRQVRATECPGDALYHEIQSWDQYSPFPNSHKDLIHVKEIPDFVKKDIIGNATIGA